MRRFLLGRSPLWAAGAVLLFALLTILVPEILRALNEGRLFISPTRVRDPLFVSPWRRPPPEELKVRIEAWEATGLETWSRRGKAAASFAPVASMPSFTSARYFDINKLQQIEPLVFKANESCNISNLARGNGQATVRLIAIATRESTGRAAPPPEKVFLPDGNPLPSAEQYFFADEYSLEPDDLFRLPSDFGAKNRVVRFVFLVRGGPGAASRIRPHSIRDATTGAIVGERYGVGDEYIELGPDLGLLFADFRFYSWHPAPVSIWFSPVNIPNLKEYRGHSLQNPVLSSDPPPLPVSHIMIRTDEGARLVSSERESLENNPWPHYNWDFALRPKSLSPDFAYYDTGRRRYLGSAGAENSGWFVLKGDHAKAFLTRIYNVPKDWPMVMLLDEIPGLPERNRDVENLLDVHVGDVYIVTRPGVYDFIQGVLQYSGDLNRFPLAWRQWAASPDSGVSAIDLRDAMVRDVMDEILANGKNPTPVTFGNTMILTTEGAMREKLSPFRARVYRVLGNGGRIMMWTMGILLFLKTWWLIRARWLQARMHQQGYETLGIFDAEFLYLALGRRAWQIPPFDEAGAVPGVDPHHMKDLVRLMRK